VPPFPHNKTKKNKYKIKLNNAKQNKPKTKITNKKYQMFHIEDNHRLTVNKGTSRIIPLQAMTLMLLTICRQSTASEKYSKQQQQKTN